MKTKILTAFAAISLLFAGHSAMAADTNAVSNDLMELVGKVKTKLQAGKDTEKDLAPELKEFDTLLAKYKDQKTDEVAQIPFMKAMLYLQVFEKPDQAAEMIRQIQTDFPKTKIAENAGQILASIKEEQAAKKIQASLVEGATFPEFHVTDLAGKPLSISNYKGKVVLLDFWATWCGPCVAELPNVLKTYEKHHADGFNIIGISLDKEREKLDSFIKEKNMTWPQYFDGQGWENKLATTYGIRSIPATYLLDGNGKIIGKDLRGEQLEEAVTKALAKK
ncbi:MAG TPA: TlpA disulfide reductase family protein [Verrucomicrobiae bacterium]|nr:TlpA disulfide reductase family protein [Verrucomicrobiae bacterium]